MENLTTFCEDEIFEKDSYKLVITTVKMGFESSVLEAAKKAGHYGATIMQAKGVSKMQRKFLGFSIAPETTMVMMIVKDEIVIDVIKSIYSVVDFKSEARGMVFALPVSLVAGLSDAYENNI